MNIVCCEGGHAVGDDVCAHHLDVTVTRETAEKWTAMSGILVPINQERT